MATIKSAGTQVKPRNSALTKDNILQAAKQAFSTRGYTGTGMRDIADAAGINVALVNRYFGTKEKLFEAALTDTLSLDELLNCVRENFGSHVVKTLMRYPESAPNPVAMMVMGTADPGVRAIALRLQQELVIKPLAKWLGGPNAESRAARVTVLCTGFVTYRDLLPLAALATGMKPVTRKWLEGQLQALADGAE